MILLDTHIWLWWLLGDGQLTQSERDALDKLAHHQQLAVSWVSVWETEMLDRKGRIRLEPSFGQWIRKAVDPDFISLLPADMEVVLAQRQLPDNFHQDPADRLIAATAVLSGCSLATYDTRFIESGACKIWNIK